MRRARTVAVALLLLVVFAGRADARGFERLDGAPGVVTVGAIGNHVSYAGYLDWRTGEFFDPPPRTARAVPTLDLPSGLAPLCGPLRVTRHAEPDFFGDPEPAFDEASLSRGRLLLHLLGRVVLRRCGTSRTRVLDRNVVLPPLLTSRHAAWISGPTVRAYVLDRRRRVSRPLPVARRHGPRPRSDRPAAVRHRPRARLCHAIVTRA